MTYRPIETDYIEIETTTHTVMRKVIDELEKWLANHPDCLLAGPLNPISTSYWQKDPTSDKLTFKIKIRYVQLSSP